MSFLKKLFKKKEKLPLADSQPMNKPSGNPDYPGDFLDAIGNLANQVRERYPESYNTQSADLPNLPRSAFPETAIPEVTQTKIKELNTIIRSMEARRPDLASIALPENLKINYSNELNHAQLTAVTSINGPVLVIAGAGSGKTRVIVYRVAFMLETGIFPQDILLLTFTRKAAGEMIGRVQELLKDATAQKIFGGTFHSFSNYILRRYANLIGISSDFTIIDTEDSADTIDLIKSELKITSKDKAFPKKHRIHEIISSAHNRNIPIKQVIDQDFTGLMDYTGQIELISLAYEKYKRICNIFDYDDLMDVLLKALKENNTFLTRIQSEYKYLMVDEYQDTNVIQKEIVELLAAKHQNVLIVGDDAQSIYSFRGANYENILRFPQKYPSCKVIKLEENYRSNQNLLDFTNEIILHARIGYKKKLFSNISRTGQPLVRKFYDQQGEAEFVVSKILEFREKGISLNQIAVLVRAFWHARYIETELNRRGIPYIAVGGLAFNERKHVKDMICYLRLLQNPYDAVAWHRILKYLPGVGVVTARRIIEKINADKGIHAQSFESLKFSEGLKALIDMLGAAAKPEMSLGRKIELIKAYYTPILQSIEHDYTVRLLDIDVLIELSGKYDSLSKFLTDFALDPPSKKFGNKTTPLVDETEDKPLTISTIHSAKGLEWYGVIIPHALDGLLPSVRALKDIEEMEEERRLFYVACSRAKQDLIITMPSYVSTYNGFMSYPSRFLAEITKDKYHYQ